MTTPFTKWMAIILLLLWLLPQPQTTTAVDPAAVAIVINII
jgi:hypothetical protein